MARLLSEVDEIRCGQCFRPSRRLLLASYTWSRPWNNSEKTSKRLFL